MRWIYLSPHLDDVALSVGGLLWEQSHVGDQVSVWTICGGDPPPGDFSPFAESLHIRWDTGARSMLVRRAEDIESCRILGANYEHFNISDCIYRRSPINKKHLYDSEEALWFPVHPDENVLIDQITAEMTEKLPPDAQVVCPFTLGNHVDHRLTRKAAEKLGVSMYFYADYPYVLKTQNLNILENHSAIQFSISKQALLAWQAAIAAHQSQISTFWKNLDEMQAAIRDYWQSMGGIKLFN